MKLVPSIIAVCAFWLASVNGANILALFPFPAKSHHAVFQPIVIELASRGHKVTYVTPTLISKTHENIKQIEVSNAMEQIKGMMETPEADKSFVERAVMWVLNRWCNVLVREIGVMAMEKFLQEPGIMDIIKDEKTKYDLIMLEMTFAQESFAALSHKFGAPIVEVMPTSNMHWSYYVHGNPLDTNYIMDIDVSYSDHMTFKERLINTAYSMASRAIISYYYMPKCEELANKYIRYPGWEIRPPLIDLVKNTSLFLMNTQLAVNYPFPLSPNVKEIGGINIQAKNKPLPKDILEFMDGAKDGVIYFTLGSHIPVATTLGDKLKGEFLKAFGKIKQRVLWKWETDFPDAPANVKVSKWFPQQDILAHKNMKLFISHGGLLSTTEAVNYAVPIIGIPIMAEQPKNINQVKVNGYGVHLDFNNLTESSISWAINEVISNPSYTQKVQERSKIFKDKKQTPLETATFWIEYVLRHNGAHHLRPAVTSLAWCQRVLLDVYTVLAVIIVTPLVIGYLFLRMIFRYICCRKSSTKTRVTKKKRE